MKARLIPLYFRSGRDKDYDAHLGNLKSLLSEEAEILEPAALGSRLPDADAALFPQLVGDAYKQLKELRSVGIPLLILTSEFGTMNMWDWEIVSFLKSEKVKTLAPYNPETTKRICKALAIKRDMNRTSFLVFQDNPGEGMQASIFKRFYWWEDRCTRLIKERFGVSLVKKSFKALGEEAKRIPDAEADRVWKSWNVKTEGLSTRAIHSAVKIYLAVKREIEKDDRVKGAGINCLNESFHSDTTPCLAWNMLFEEKGLIWACEADTMALLSKYLIYKSLGVPIMMSNVYPFLMGMSALKHEKIDMFPQVKGNPDNYMLVAHCGYLGVLPRPFATEWTLRPKVLGIVDENAHAMDARLPVGPVTLAKLDPTLTKMVAIEGEIEGYVQYPGSDCRNGAVIRVPDGHKLMKGLHSHHNCIMTGHVAREIGAAAEVFDLEMEVL